MPTSDRSFLFSRRNIVGVVLAAAVIVLHLVVGLGVLWPVVAAAGYGAGVALTPARRRRELTTVEGPALAGVDELRVGAARQIERLKAHSVPRTVIHALADFEVSALKVLDNWAELVDFPEHQVTVRAMITRYMPELVDSYLRIPDRTEPRAVNDIISSLNLLRDEAEHIYEGILENNLNRLEDHGRVLRMQFGRLPETDPGRGTLGEA